MYCNSSVPSTSFWIVPSPSNNDVGETNEMDNEIAKLMNGIAILNNLLQYQVEHYSHTPPSYQSTFTEQGVNHDEEYDEHFITECGTGLPVQPSNDEQCTCTELSCACYNLGDDEKSCTMVETPDSSCMSSDSGDEDAIEFVPEPSNSTIEDDGGENMFNMSFGDEVESGKGMMIVQVPKPGNNTVDHVDQQEVEDIGEEMNGGFGLSNSQGKNMMEEQKEYHECTGCCGVVNY